MKTILTDALVENNASRDALIEHARHMEEQRQELIEALRNALRSDKYKVIAEMEATALLRKLGV